MILLSGFEPFDGAEVNPSAEIVHAIDLDPPSGIDLATTILPVETGVAAERLLSMVDECGADIVLMLGEARGRSVISIEQVAVNLLDFSIPGNAGHQVRDRRIVENGPDAIFATLPVRALVDALRDQDIPAERSLTAGTYLCNEVSYRVLERSRRQDESASPIAGFIHLPSLPSPSNTGMNMPLDLEVHAIRIILSKLFEAESGDCVQIS